MLLGPYHIETNQSIDLLCKSLDWFVYDRDLRAFWKSLDIKGLKDFKELKDFKF